MNPKPILSIIIPFYNTERYLMRCINSILGQSFKNWELILIDDGSTDDSFKICKEFEDKDSRIILLSQKNAGQGAARNYGLTQSKGEYIAFIDSDDLLIDPNSLLYAIESFNKEDGIDIVQFPFIKFNDSSTIIEPNRNCTIISSKSDIIEHTDILNMIYPTNVILKTSPWAKIFRKNLFDKVNFPVGMIYEDTFMMCEMIPYINKISITKNGLYGNYERISSTTTSPLNIKKATDRIKTLIKVLETLCKYSTNKTKIKGTYHWIIKIIASFKAQLKDSSDLDTFTIILSTKELWGGVMPKMVSIIGTRNYIYLLSKYFKIKFKINRLLL